MKNIKIIIALLSPILFSCHENSNNGIKSAPHAKKKRGNTVKVIYKSENLVIRQISNSVYEHITFLEKDSEKIPCNGMIFIHNEDAVILDTPTNDQASVELIEYLSFEMNLTINAVVATSFHTDCLGGLLVFHKYGINSYASNQTIKLAKKYNPIIPEQGFDTELALEVGEKIVYLEHLGEAHTKGNIIGYFPDGEFLFGGGIIKELGAKKDNLENSNSEKWYNTIYAIKAKYPNAKTIIPGQGEIGGPELLDYTMNLFALK